MARQVNKLTVREVAALKEPGMHADGAGLYLRVDQTLNKRWVFVFFTNKKRREMGLGSASAVDLKAARDAADAARKLVKEGKDPIADRQAEVTAATTFEDVAKKAIAVQAEGWRGGKDGPTAEQWLSSLETHAADLWSKPVAAISTEDVVGSLKPIWQVIPETASRVRSRIEHVLDVARVDKLREGENPARWKGHLKLMLGRQARAKGHHAAMAYEDVPTFVQQLRQRRANAARALEFLILGGNRTTEVREARWPEIGGDLWTIPAERMKGNREHIVTLTPRMLEILDEMRFQRTDGDYIFPGDQRIEPLSNMARLNLLQRMNVKVTVHGFRSSFRDWAGDCTNFGRDVAEMALAHRVGDETELAYRRRTAITKRRELMLAWEGYCTTPPASNIRQFRRT
jgi:integrase